MTIQAIIPETAKDPSINARLAQWVKYTATPEQIITLLNERDGYIEAARKLHAPMECGHPARFRLWDIEPRICLACEWDKRAAEIRTFEGPLAYLKTVYDQYKHMAGLLSNPASAGAPDFRSTILADFWKAISQYNEATPK